MGCDVGSYWIVSDARQPAWFAWPYHQADLPEDDMLSLPLLRVMRVLRYEALAAEQMAKEHGLETRRGA